MRFLKILVVCLAGIAAPALAEDPMDGILPNYVGAGAGVAPEYLGSRRSTFGVAPALRWQFQGSRYISLLGPRIEANLVDHPNFQFGPIVNYRFGRSGAEDRAVRNLGKLDAVVEGGFTVGTTYIGTGSVPFRIRGGVSVVSDMSGAYGGVSVLPFANLWVPLSPQVFVGLGASARISPAAQNRYYFGISPAQSLRSGLSAYDPGGGFSSISAWPAVVWRFADNWTVSLAGHYTRLSDEAARSPIVRRGSRDQFVGGLGIAYLW